MPDLQVRFLDDISALVHHFTYVQPDGTELGPIACDTTRFKGWDEIRWLRFPAEEKALLDAENLLEARELLIGLVRDWVSAQNPDWPVERLLSLLSIRECYHLAAFFGGGRLLGAFLQAKTGVEVTETAPAETPATKPAKSTRASKVKRSAVAAA